MENYDFKQQQKNMSKLVANILNIQFTTTSAGAM